MLGARAALVHIRTELDTDFVEDAIMKANMEKRWVGDQINWHNRRCYFTDNSWVTPNLFSSLTGKPCDCIEYIQRSARQGHIERKISFSTHSISALFAAFVFGMIALKLEVSMNNIAVLSTPLYSAYVTLDICMCHFTMLSMLCKFNISILFMTNACLLCFPIFTDNWQCTCSH